MLLVALFACSDGKDDGSVLDDTSGGGGCFEPTADILEPAEGAQFVVGDTVTMRGEVTSTGDVTDMEVLWAVEDDVIGLGTEETWLAAETGDFLVRFQATDECGVGQDQVTITVADAGG